MYALIVFALLLGTGALTEMARSGTVRIASLLLALSVASCGATATTAPADLKPQLGVSNGTALTVTLVVDGQTVGEFPPGGPGPTIDTARLPALPWSVEARSPSGRVLTSMHIEPGQVGSRSRPDGGTESSGTFGRVDLSCGRLTIWAGDFQPSGPPPPPSPGTNGDCVP
jgi:hypothetical protein